MRVYVPATLSLLAAALSRLPERQLPPGAAFAVTPGMREWYSSGDTEELEYIAMSLAAEASVRLIAADPSCARRRVVVAAELDADLVTADGGGDRASRGRVTVRGVIALSKVAAVHVDDAQSVAVIAAAAADPDDEVAAEQAADQRLLWYATQELDDLIFGEPGT